MVRFGWKKDPPRLSDFPATPKLRAAPPPPRRASNRQLILSVLDQGNLGSCVANAVAQALRAAMVREGAINPPLASRLWLYYLARAYDHDTANDDGTRIRNAFAAAVKYGLPPESAWPYIADPTPGAPFSRMPPQEAFREGFDQRAPTTYMRINTIGDDRIDEIRRALAAGFCVVFGTQVSQEFCDGNTKLIAPPTRSVGGHALTLAEYDQDDEDEFKGPNSWGKWGDKDGWFSVSPAYLKWGATDDLWIVERTPVIPRAA